MWENNTFYASRTILGKKIMTKWEKSPCDKTRKLIPQYFFGPK